MAEKQFLTTLKFVEDIIKVIPDGDRKDKLTHLVESIRNADGLEIDPADENRRIAMLNLNAVALAQQATWEAFSANVMTKEIEDGFRALPDVAGVQDAARAEEENVKSEEDEISKTINAFRERAKKFDIVRAVCNGQDPKEAKKQQAEYEKQAQSMRG